MSTNDLSGPSARRADRNPARRQGNTDLRIRRTRERLGAALIALIEEKAIQEVTIREVLDRAKVGRSTFYVHYQDKDDLLLSQLEEGLQMWSNFLSTRQEKSRRVAPVAEFFAHVASARKLYRSLVVSGRIQAFFDLAQGYFARGIARRLREIGLPIPDQREFDARAHALAGNLLSLLRWWLDRGAKEKAEDMDNLFQRMVWKGLG
ncbi:MAG TPA: TetR/AcrR family transcriptional regulator [Bryobacteraceae bacterium]|nr:TetR/AcrR family transcriptional regulator [Bryobacteraceae bacterium]